MLSSGGANLRYRDLENVIDLGKVDILPYIFATSTDKQTDQLISLVIDLVHNTRCCEIKL